MPIATNGVRQATAHTWHIRIAVSHLARARHAEFAAGGKPREDGMRWSYFDEPFEAIKLAMQNSCKQPGASRALLLEVREICEYRALNRLGLKVNMMNVCPGDVACGKDERCCRELHESCY